MLRQIIHINEEKCNGCGLCAKACHEGAIDIVEGKAKLVRENFCDGFGDCLPACPMDAIKFEVREAPDYDEEAVNRAKNKGKVLQDKTLPIEISSELTMWPVQIKLSPIKAKHFDDMDLLIARDCTAYAYGNFHRDFMRGKAVLIGCPKLDATDYSEKLTEILRNNRIKSITITKMIVPCCTGLEMAVKKAIIRSKKELPLEVYTIGTDGNIIK